MVNNCCKLNPNFGLLSFIFKIIFKESTKPTEMHMKIIQMSGYTKFEGQHIPTSSLAVQHLVEDEISRQTGRKKNNVGGFLLFFYPQYHTKQTLDLGFILSLNYFSFPLQLWSSASGQKAVPTILDTHNCVSDTHHLQLQPSSLQLIAKNVQKQQQLVLNTVAVY